MYFELGLSLNPYWLVDMCYHDVLLHKGTRRTMEGITGQTVVIFAGGHPPGAPFAGLNLTRILDMAPITVTDQTPMETVVDMFRKLGLRQTLVTHNG